MWKSKGYGAAQNDLREETDMLFTGEHGSGRSKEVQGLEYDAEPEKKRLLLHSCCGPCSTAVIERLAPRFCLTVYFYNPNITEPEEYGRRKETQLQFLYEYNRTRSSEEQVEFIEGDYEPQEYFRLTRGLENEPEGGARCDVCFRMRLAGAAQAAQKGGFDLFSTTLSVSPHKNFPLIAQIGQEEGERLKIPFLAEDFKKKDGYRRSVALSKEYGLYRQNFCGCRFAREMQNQFLQNKRKQK